MNGTRYSLYSAGFMFVTALNILNIYIYIYTEYIYIYIYIYS